MTGWEIKKPTGMLVMPDGTALTGKGLGAVGEIVGEVCFNTAITGYQEILTDPSYAGQIVTFTFPHVGNVGTNDEDTETSNKIDKTAAQGMIIREDITAPANYRAYAHLDNWLKQQNLIGLCGVDTRALTRYIRENGMFNAALAHHPEGDFDTSRLSRMAEEFSGLEGLDLAGKVSTTQTYQWQQGRWQWQSGFDDTSSQPKEGGQQKHVVALDFGIKQNILRCLSTAGCRVTVLPADSSAEEVLALSPDGVFLSNGPGDPAATGNYAVPEIKKIVASGKPVFGICLGHQMLALALGAQTKKMAQGHHGANHPVQDLGNGKVEITSMNHGFTVARESLPETVEETHVSLFDGTNCGIALKGKPVFSVQYHPEASPGPQDSHYLFDRFVAVMNRADDAQASGA